MALHHQYQGQRICIFGIGITGRSTIDTLLETDVGEIICTDDDVEKLSLIENDKNYEKYIKNKKLKIADISQVSKLIEERKISAMVLSPGIPAQPAHTHELVKSARKFGVEIVSDLDLLYISDPDAMYIGITGTNGKSTTTSLIGHILKKTLGDGAEVKVAGNIGTPALHPENRKTSRKRIYVLEISSFQLDIIKKLKLDVAICLNITPDHFDRYGTLEKYSASKMQIFKKLTKPNGYKVISVDSPETLKIYTELESSESKGGYVIPISKTKILKNGVSFVDSNLELRNVLGVKEYKSSIHDKEPLSPSLYGAHNKENMIAAVAACLALQLDININKILDALSDFIGLPHRMQVVKRYKDLLFINDSKGTNIESTRCAVESFENIHWIIGGISKDEGIESLSKLFNRIACAYLIGAAAEKFAKVLARHKVQYKMCGTLQGAISQIQRSVTSGTVLLSPACSSFDQWRNFEERGNFFIEQVNKLW